MKKIARVLSLFAIAALATVTIASCAPGAASPKSVVQGALDAVKAQDSAALQKYYAGNTSDANVTDIAGQASGIDLSSVPEDQRAMAEQLVNQITSFDYELGEETIDGDTATVKATITTYDLGSVFSDTINEYLGKAFAAAFTGTADQDAMTQMFMEIFTEKMSAQTEKTYVADTTFALTKVDGEWKLDTLSQENLDCILGGLYSSAQDLANSFSELGASLGGESAASSNAA